ncbi:hypothetical protein C8F01DRAFT_677033 [Mycena amicta]|nr:hypothetical protein C8F01DRAFT_677033 [Mycena amicta]
MQTRSRRPINAQTSNWPCFRDLTRNNAFTLGLYTFGVCARLLCDDEHPAERLFGCVWCACELCAARDVFAPPLPRHPSSETYQPPSSRPPNANAIPDDGRPTTTPVAGHPLLLNGKMLVYPAGHECHKCNNTGYRHSDPSHPCRRCWDKYAKPNAGALLVAPASSPGGSSGNTHGATFQRPLPRLYAAGTRPISADFYSAPSSSSSSYAPPANPHPSSSYAPPSHPPPPPSTCSYPPPPQHPSFSTSTSSSSSSLLGQYPGSRQPMPTSMLPPGDPRLGGALCWRCSGRGRVSFLVFETLPCSACGGVGRVYG